MSKVSVDDLNFDDISGETVVKIVPPEEEGKKVKPIEDDYKLAIRLENNKLQLINLETCTSDEFYTCVSQMYPYMGDAEAEEIFNSKQARIRTLKHVINFHTEVYRPLKNLNIGFKKESKPLIN